MLQYEMLRYGGQHEEEPDPTAIIEHLTFLDDHVRPAAHHALMMAGEWFTLRERQDLFQQEQELQKIFVLLEGTMHLSRLDTDEHGRSMISLRRTAEPGDILGKYDLLYRNPHSVRARALENCRLLAIDTTAINRLIFQFPTLRNQIAPLDIIGRMRTMPFFAGISLTELSFIADSVYAATDATKRKVQRDKWLYRQGDSLDNIYLVAVGQVKLTGEDDHELWVGNGAAFGFCEQPRSPWEPWTSDHNAITTAAETELLVIPRRALFDIANLDADAIGTKLRKEMRDTIQRLTLFRKFPAEKCDKLLGFMNHYHIAGHHHLLMQQGEIGDSLWVLMPGRKATMVALEQGREIAKSQVYGPTYFSEAALRVMRYLEATIDAEPDSEWLRLHWKDFRMFLHEGEADLVDRLTMTVDVDSLLGEQVTRELYPWLEEGEQLIQFQKRHWVALVSRLIAPFILTIVTVIGWVFFGQLLPLTTGMSFLVGTPIFIILVAIWLWGIADYANDYILVTNRRVVRQEKVILINELRQSAFLRQVQNVDVTRSFVGSMLGFGTVNIQTAGSGGAIIFERLGDPNKIRDAIFEERTNHQAQYQAEGKMEIQKMLEERLGLTLKMPARVRLDVDAILVKQEEKTLWDRISQYFEPDMPQSWNELDEIRWRKHWFILVRNLTIPVLTTLASIFSVLLFLAPVLFIESLRSFATPVLAIPTAVISLFGIGWILWVFVDWRNDQYIVSGDEIVDVEKKPLFFAEDRRAARLDNIENVQLKMSGPINFILNFGNVDLQTAARDGDFTFDYVPNPRAVAEEIRRRIENVTRQKEVDRVRSRAEELPDWFETFSRLDSERDPTAPGGI